MKINVADWTRIITIKAVGAVGREGGYEATIMIHPSSSFKSIHLNGDKKMERETEGAGHRRSEKTKTMIGYITAVTVLVFSLFTAAGADAAIMDITFEWEGSSTYKIDGRMRYDDGDGVDSTNVIDLEMTGWQGPTELWSHKFYEGTIANTELNMTNNFGFDVNNNNWSTDSTYLRIDTAAGAEGLIIQNGAQAMMQSDGSTLGQILATDPNVGMTWGSPTPVTAISSVPEASSMAMMTITFCVFVGVCCSQMRTRARNKVEISMKSAL
ncbi:hypothetical protein QUF76_13210 [Desulfobacterales bacterium HSG16]|nr:hypothetical protein [Desulfobacterales bacterium HSG16]